MNSDPMKVAASAVARVDALEVLVTKQAADLKAIRALVDQVAGGVKRLLKGEEEEADGQPDWIRVRSEAEAEALLEAATAWHDTTLVWLGARMHPCWPWHPLLMVEVLALAELYAAAYSADDPKGTGDFLNRFLPAFKERARAELVACSAGEHSAEQRSYRCDRGQLPELAKWWATSRTGAMPGMAER